VHVVQAAVRTLDRVVLAGTALPGWAQRMARSPAGGASTLQAKSSLPLSTREAIRGRRLRRDGGILLFQRELTLEIGAHRLRRGRITCPD
jgi:hypothetical protein